MEIAGKRKAALRIAERVVQRSREINSKSRLTDSSLISSGTICCWKSRLRSTTSFSSSCKTYCRSCSIEFSFPKRYIASCSPPPRPIPSNGFLQKPRIGLKFDPRRKSIPPSSRSILVNERSSRWRCRSRPSRCYLDASSPRRRRSRRTCRRQSTRRRGGTNRGAPDAPSQVGCVDEEMRHWHRDVAQQFGNQPTHVINAAEQRRAPVVERACGTGCGRAEGRHACTTGRGKRLSSSAILAP